jgi:hypothetical protein
MNISVTAHTWFKLTATIILMIAVTAPQVLQAEEPLKMTQVIRLYDGILHYPSPLWMKTKDKIGDFSVYKKQEDNTFTFEMIPKSQKFDSWTNIYGVYAWKLPEYDLKRFFEESLHSLSLGCKKQANSSLVAVEDGRMVLTYHCPSLVDELVCEGNNAESGFLYLSQVNSTFVKVYQAWRYDSRKIGTEQAPMTKEVIVEAAEDMKAIRFVSAE